MLHYEREKHGHILTYWGVLSQLCCEKHGIKQKDLDLLLYFYGMNQGYFKKADFLQYRRAFPQFHNSFKTFMKNGFFTTYRKAAPRQVAIYRVSDKAIRIISILYKQLFGEIVIRTDCNRTTYYGKALPMHRHVVKSGLVDVINAESGRRQSEG